MLKSIQNTKKKFINEHFETMNIYFFISKYKRRPIYFNIFYFKTKVVQKFYLLQLLKKQNTHKVRIEMNKKKGLHFAAN